MKQRLLTAILLAIVFWTGGVHLHAGENKAEAGQHCIACHGTIASCDMQVYEPQALILLAETVVNLDSVYGDESLAQNQDSRAPPVE